ncbi:MAG: SMC-Scp complex subunit ScpB [Microlunatus sp.]|nr:SMC-Scp complex subunit ScpB [Microlunatus sp.]
MTDETMGPDAEPAPDREQQEPLVDQPRVGTPEQLRGALEALLLIADEPISETDLAAALRVPTDEVTAALADLVAFYTETGRGFELRKLAGGWRYYTREDYADVIGAYVLEGRTAKLSQAALETLAVIAYLQPISRSRVSAVRGVNVDGVVRTLLARDLVTETGSEESGAILFRTTDYFLERMGLQSLEELPELAPYLPEATELEEELGQLAVLPAAGSEPDTLPAEPEAES